MTDSKRAGEPAQQSDLINVAQHRAVLRTEAGSGQRGACGEVWYLWPSWQCRAP
jgi:hypothetical protein